MKPVHVFLCLTPFHCHVALSVARKADVVNDAVFLIITDGAERAFSSPVSMLINSGLERKAIIECVKGVSVKGLLCLLRCRGGFFYAANVKKFYTRFAIKLMSPAKLATFDDGFANVSGGGYFYKRDEKKLKQVLLVILGIPSYPALISTVSRHYSIYPKLDNVYEVTDYVSISYETERIKKESVLGKKYDVAFVGSPLSESGLIDSDLEVEKIIEVISRFEGDALYLCHPRDSEKKLGLIKSVAPSVRIYRHDDIVEALLVEEKENIGCVAGFFSSTLLNIAEDFPGRVCAKKVEVADGCTLYSKIVESNINILN